MSSLQTPDTYPPSYALWRWAEPLVHDALAEIYRHELADEDAAHSFAKRHARLWGLMSAHQPDLEGLMELEVQLGLLGHGLDLVHRANAAVATELAELVRSCYRTHPREQDAFALSLADLNAGMAAALCDEAA